MTSRDFISGFMSAVDSWGLGWFIDHLLSSMIRLWADRLHDTKDGWRALAEAREAAAKQAATSEHTEVQPPQWTLPFTRPRLGGVQGAQATAVRLAAGTYGGARDARS
jgi:hypothetical protein